MSPQIYYFHIDHNIPCLPPRILHNHCFQFLLGITVAPREIQDNGHAKKPSNQKRTANRVRNTRTTTLSSMRGKIVYRRYCVFVTATFFCPQDSCCGEVPGGVLLGILCGGVPPPLLRTQKCHFHTPCQSWPLKFISVFRPGL